MAKKMFMQAMGRAVVILWVLMIAAVGHVSGQIEATPPAVPTPPTVLSPPTGVTLPSADEFAPAPGPSLEDLFPPCQGVLVVYTTTFTKKIYPYLNDTPWIQPYRFQALATLLNQGYSTIANWEMGITYQHGEILVNAGGAVLNDGSRLPADVSNGTVLTGAQPQKLMNAIETAGDLQLIQRIIPLVGTEFGIKRDPMPKSINITTKDYNCSVPTMKGNNTMYTCCLEKNRNITLTDDGETYLPEEAGNITILYDVTQSYENNYMAMVTISNNMPITRIDHWNLSWTWTENEFINSIMGAQTFEADIKTCVNGLPGRTYAAGPDVNKAACCSVNPIILDLPLDRTNDTNIGGIKNCCKNGTIYPAIIDPKKTKSAFLMNVYKVPPGSTDMTYVVPPVDFKFGDGANTTDGYYTCGKPRLIKPTVYPDPWNSLIHQTSAVKTWQITCNITQEVKRIPKCCVSFSAYYNESVVPCRNGACGHPVLPPSDVYGDTSPTCDANAPAMLLPYGALTLAPVNRTKKITAWAALNHKAIPSPLPCTDYCGININWHIVSDFTKGWSARLTLLDWSNITYPDWFAVIEMPKATPGLQEAYTMNATRLPLLNNSLGDPLLNNTFVVTGLEGYNNYLMAAQNLSSGKIQSVVSFTKETTPGILVPMGDGFPTRIFFNGEECVMPEYQPINGSGRVAPSLVFGFILACLSFFLLGPLGL
ncbi:hypothetical protein M758_1G294500 [Ceratodon purpureus]|nr:hypothetical protein M758_1G294500 [Ceratodon purpureus]